MKTEPTDAEINEELAMFCGWEQRDNLETHVHFPGGYKEIPVRRWFPSNSQLSPPLPLPRFTTSFDTLREVMGKMTEEQQSALRADLLCIWRKNESLPMVESFGLWLLFYCPVRTLAEAVYQVVKGEK